MDADPPSRRLETTERVPPSAPETLPRHRRVFYGWWIVGAGLTAEAIHFLVFNIGSAALFLPIAREFATSRTVVSGAFAASRVEGGLTGPVEGFLIHWIGARRLMMVGWVVFGAGLITIGLSQSITHFYAAFLLTALGQSMAGFLPITTVLMNWFFRLRGRAVAIFQLGGSLGALLVPLLAWFILNVGWRQSMVAAGILVILVGVPLAMVMRNRPEDYGHLPDGALPQEAAPSQQHIGGDGLVAAGTDADGPTVGQALRSRSFWFLTTAQAASMIPWGALRVHLIPALVDMGQAEQVAANVLSMTLTVAAVGRLFGGFLGDYLGVRRVLVISILVQAASTVLLTLASTLAHAVVFAVVFGIAFGARGTLLTVLRGEIFGRTNFSRLTGLMDPVTTVGFALAPVLAGYLFDVQGSYRAAFLILGAVSALGAVLVLGVRMPRRAARPA